LSTRPIRFPGAVKPDTFEKNRPKLLKKSPKTFEKIAQNEFTVNGALRSKNLIFD
jgi:hypothetical protein